MTFRPCRTWVAPFVGAAVMLIAATLVSAFWGARLRADGPPPSAGSAAEELASDGATSGDGEFAEEVRPFLERHCYSCHGAETQESGLRLDTLSADFTTSTVAGHWVEVMDKLNLGEMPPPGGTTPEVEELTRVTDWVAGQLRRSERASLGGGGKVVLRRMNRDEYANTIRDLLGMDFLPGESPTDFLPPDGTAEGFDKVSVALMLDPSLLDKYFDVARRIADRALVDGPPPFPTEVMRLEMEEIAENRAIRYLCASSGIECLDDRIVLMQGSTRSFGVMKYPGTRDEIPVKGMYRVRVRAWGERGRDGDAVIMRVRQGHPQEDQQLLIETEVTAEPAIYETVVARDPKCGEYNVSIVNDINFQTTSRVGSQIRRLQREAGEAKDYERVMRLQSRQQMEGLTWGRPNPDAADTSHLRKLHVDWTMLNERLASFYGIEGVAGDEFRRVALPDGSPRGGLLGMAGVAMRGSDGNRTKPVSRGVYVREVLFNDPPNPPPPNAGEVEPNIEGERLTVRDRLIQHQQIESCAACHRGIDPYGFALENFNVIGAWRENQDGEDFRGRSAPPVDSSGTLPSGKSFATFREFKSLLLEQKDRFARGLTEKMLIYALGRPVGPSDRGLVDRLAGRMAEDDYRLSSLIRGIVASEAFQSK